VVSGRRSNTRVPDAKDSFDGAVPEARAYTYDLDSNRTSVTESGTTTYYAYDRSDELIWKGPNSDGSGSSAFEFDSLGQMTTSQPARPGSGVLHPTDYAYDPAGHLTGITADGQTTSFAIDALGRHASQTIGSGATTSYAYLGTSDTVSSSSQSGVVSYSAIDAIGDRLTTGTTSAFGWLLVDLHGNVIGVMTSGSSPSYSSAYRFDAYGETCDLYTAGSGAIKSPWRFQGRILESADGSTDLYDFQARSYDPSLGAFTSLDSVSGSAQNPLTLNRFLYAAANPATLVDPDGHRAVTYAENGDIQPKGQVQDCYLASGKMVCGQEKTDPFSTWGRTVISRNQPKGGPGGEGRCDIDDCSTRNIMNRSWEKFVNNQTHSPRPECNHNYACDINNAIGTFGDWIFKPPLGDSHFGPPLAVRLGVVGGAATGVAVCVYVWEACAGAVSRLTQGGDKTATSAESSLLRLAPEVEDPKLQNIIRNLYKHVGETDQIGDGTTMAAIRYEVQNNIDGPNHFQAGDLALESLERVILRPGVSPADKDAALGIMRELLDAFEGQ
jgi:RHS repeat-associated protein